MNPWEKRALEVIGQGHKLGVGVVPSIDCQMGGGQPAEAWRRPLQCVPRLRGAATAGILGLACVQNE